MQLQKALCELLWVSHKAPVTHSQEQVQRGAGRTSGSQGLSPGGPRRPGPRSTGSGREGGREVLHLHCLHSGARLAVSTEVFYHRHQRRKSSDRGRMILLTWSFL